MRRIRKCCVRNSSCASIGHRVITFDQKRFVGSLSVLKVPAMIWIRLNNQCLSFTIRVDQGCGYKVDFGNGVSISKRKRVSEYSLNRAPNLGYER